MRYRRPGDCHGGRRCDRHRRRWLIGFGIVAFDRTVEFSFGVPEAAGEFGDALRAEHDHHDDQHDDEVRSFEQAQNHRASPMGGPGSEPEVGAGPASSTATRSRSSEIMTASSPVSSLTITSTSAVTAASSSSVARPPRCSAASRRSLMWCEFTWSAPERRCGDRHRRSHEHLRVSSLLEPSTRRAGAV